MDDLISRKALCEYALNQKDKSITPNDIMRFPAAQPEIIHCKDCKHYEFTDNRAFGFPAKWCEWSGFEDMNDDDFCSRGERKE